jgi:hypothetical protein
MRAASLARPASVAATDGHRSPPSAAGLIRKAPLKVTNLYLTAAPFVVVPAHDTPACRTVLASAECRPCDGSLDRSR